MEGGGKGDPPPYYLRVRLKDDSTKRDLRHAHTTVPPTHHPFWLPAKIFNLYILIILY